MEKLLVTQALDERDFLKKKINDDINRLNPITVKRKKDPKTSSGLEVKDFEEAAKSQYQSIVDNIARYNRLCAAIIESNANTKITVNGEEMTIAKAITLRKEFEKRDYLELQLHNALSEAFVKANRDNDAYNRKVVELEDKHKTNLLLSSENKDLEPSQIKYVEDMVAGDYPEIIDPLGLEKLLTENKEKITSLIKELDTAIKISNATTTIEF